MVTLIATETTQAYKKGQEVKADFIKSGKNAAYGRFKKYRTENGEIVNIAEDESESLYENGFKVK